MIAITPSNTCQALRELIKGDKTLALNPNEKKNRTLAKPAPAQKNKLSSYLTDTVPIRIKVSM